MNAEDHGMQTGKLVLEGAPGQTPRPEAQSTGTFLGFFFYLTYQHLRRHGSHHEDTVRRGSVTVPFRHVCHQFDTSYPTITVRRANQGGHGEKISQFDCELGRILVGLGLLTGVKVIGVHGLPSRLHGVR
jgi:hypothetical protein